MIIIPSPDDVVDFEEVAEKTLDRIKTSVRDSEKLYHLHEGVGDGRQEGGGSGGCPKVMEAGMILEAAQRRSEADCDITQMLGCSQQV